MKKVLLSLFFTMFAAQGNAATFDFIGEANDGFSLGTAGEQGYTGTSYVREVDGITLTAQGQSTSNDGTTWDEASVYLDSYWNGGNAGMGVCKALSVPNNQCNPGGDDNVTLGEKLILDFGQQVAISEIIMSNGVHENDSDAFTGQFNLTIDGVDMGQRDLASAFTTALIGQRFELWNNNTEEKASKEFYIGSMSVSAVPIPAAVWLFGSALMGLVGVSRRKSSAVVA